MNEKEIEEMASDMNYGCVKHDLYPDDAKEIAKALFILGYRKIPEGSVVLTDEEAERFRGQTVNIAKVKAQARKETLEKIKLKPIECGEECGYYYLDISVTGKELLQRVYFNSDFIDGKVRKETAKEILSLAIKHNDGYETDMARFIDDLKKQYGVEVEE